MRIINENYKTIDESEADLKKGFLVNALSVREDAKPIDNITKFAWSDDDYEEVKMYRIRTTETEPTIQDEMDAMLIDQEYRITLLELGIS